MDTMPEKEILSLKVGDVFYFNDFYVNSEYKHVKHSYKLYVVHVVIEEGVFRGILLKRWLITKMKWSYEFFDYNKIEYKCSIERKIK